MKGTNIPTGVDKQDTLIEQLDENQESLKCLVELIKSGGDKDKSITASKGVIGYLVQASSLEHEAAEALRTQQAKLDRIDKATDGIYPASNMGVQRSQWQDGWNACSIHVSEAMEQDE